MARTAEERRGRRMARLFRQYRELPDNQRACELGPLLEEDDLEVVVSRHADPGYTACLVQPVPNGPAGILLAPGQSRGRQRFSIAHELGHYHIPTHRGRETGWCGEDDMAARAETARTIEWEANDFAAEMLMPRTLFARDTKRRDPTFEQVGQLADPDMYDVSRTAAALRFVEVTRQRCALVCAKDGVIEWVAKSDDFPYRIHWIGDPVPPGSVASFTFDGDGPVATAEELDPYIWLEIEQRRPVELFESTLAVPTQDQVLSLVWVVPEGSLV